MALDDPPRAETAAPPDAPPPARRRRRLWPWATALALLPALVVAGLAGLAVWLAQTEAGTRTLLPWIPGVQVTSPRGALVGDFSAERVEIALPRNGGVTLQSLRWTGLQPQFPSGDGPWAPLPRLRLRIERLDIDRIVVRPGAPDPAPPGPPLQRLVLPAGLEIVQARIGELRLADRSLAPLREMQFGLTLADGNGTHRLDTLALAWDRLTLRGEASLGAEAPMPLDARLDLREQPAAALPPPGPSPLPPVPDAFAGWTATLQARGPLERFALEASLRAKAQAVDASAEITPFAPLPLAALDATTDRLDLSVLHSSAPRTALTARVAARLAAPAAAVDPARLPLQIDLDLRNEDAGRWDAQRLPLQRLRVEGSGTTGAAASVELGRFEAELGSPREPGGKVSGTARWDAGRWQLDTRLESLAPAALDQRAPALVASGPVELRGAGPLPFGAAPPASGASAPAGSIDGTARLTGRWTGPETGLPRGPMALTLDAGMTRERITIRQATLGAEGAQARLSGTAAPRARVGAGGPGWALAGELALADFDPRPWSQAVAAALGERPTRLNGQGRFDLQLPSQAPRARGLAPWLAAWRGQARFALADSQLAGAPLEATLQVDEDAPNRRVRAEVGVLTGGNRLAAEGTLDTADEAGSGDRWQLSADAPALATLAPLLELVRPGLALQGSLQADARIEGRWPRLQADGTLSTAALRAAGATLARGSARWRVGTEADDPVDLQAALDDLQFGGQRVEQVRISLNGSGRAHTLDLDARARPVEPAADAAAGPTAAPAGLADHAQDLARRRLVATLQASGGWQGDPAAGGLGWRGRIARLDVVPALDDAPAATGATPNPLLPGGGAPWLRVEPFDLAWASDATAQSLRVGATRVSLLDAVLRLSTLDWTAPREGATRLQLDAELEPLAVAPLLARLQPDFGWGGDLRVGGKVSMRSAAGEGFVADAVLERRGGDLDVTDRNLEAVSVPLSAAGSAPAQRLDLGATQRFRLRELKLAFSARDGVWRFSQRIDGRNLGQVTGEQTVQAARDAVWPGPDAPLRGQLDVKVESLGIWGGWVPAGWRLGGSLDSESTLGGTFGAPQYTGRLSGSGLSARNLLEGVNLSDGDLEVQLQGASARIERFTLRGGTGQLRVDGGADFGEVAQARLEVTAERFEALARVDRRLMVSGRATVLLTPDRLEIDGRLQADEGLFDIARGDAPGLDEDVQVLGGGAAEAEPVAAAPAPAPRRNLVLDLRADLGQKLRLRGRGLDTLLRGDLRLTSPGGRPALNGVIRTEDGTYAAYAQRLTIERGTVTFAGPIDNPQLDILALRARSPSAIDSDVNVGVLITGPAQNPRVRLWSEPEMSDTDKLSWLVLGRAPGGLGRTELALVQQAALALLAGEEASQSDQLLQNLGIDELSVRQQDDGSVRETVVSLGKQLSSRWYVGYERSLNATTGTWQLIYRIARRFTLRAQSGLDNSLDLIWTWRWQ